MKIIVRAKAGAKTTMVEKLSQSALPLPEMEVSPDIYRVSVKEPPIDGKANNAIVKALAEYFGIASFRVHLVSGQRAKRKIFEID